MGTGLELFKGSVDSVTVTGSGGNGVEILRIQGWIGQLPLSIQRSNLFNNAGVGMNNGNFNNPISAPNIWWGDPQGPNGSFGDGISGAADPTPSALAPIGLVTPYPTPPAPSGSAQAPVAAPRAGPPGASMRPWPKNWALRHRSRLR